MAYFIDKEKHKRNYLKDALKHEMTNQPYVRKQPLAFPTCTRCGRIAFRHKRRDWVLCPVCGHHGPAGPTIRTVWDRL